MLTILQTMLGAFMGPKVIITLGTIIGMVLGDTILGILVAIKIRQFTFSKLAQFVQTSLVPYVGGLLVLALFSNSNTELGALFFTVAAAITAKFIADILSKVSQLFGGFIQIQSPIKIEKTDSTALPDQAQAAEQPQSVQPTA